MKFKHDIHDKRDGVRINFNMPVEIFCPEMGNSLKGVLMNLSVHGMLLELQKGSTAATVDESRLCMARLIFRGKASNLMIDELQFTLARQEENKLALKFNEPLEWFLLFTVYRNKQTVN